MKANPERRFTLFDAMVLVAALALGLAQARTWHPSYKHAVVALTTLDRVRQGTEAAFDWVFAPSYACLVSLTGAVLVLRFRAPRPGLRRLVRLPGFLACVFPCLMLALNSIRVALYLCFWHVFNDLMWPHWVPSTLWYILFHDGVFPFSAPILSGVALGAVWLSLLIAGRWKTERTWIDRLGRVLGVIWVVVVPLVSYWVILFRN